MQIECRVVRVRFSGRDEVKGKPRGKSNKGSGDVSKDMKGPRLEVNVVSAAVRRLVEHQGGS